MSASTDIVELGLGDLPIEMAYEVCDRIDSYAERYAFLVAWFKAREGGTPQEVVRGVNELSYSSYRDVDIFQTNYRFE